MYPIRVAFNYTTRVLNQHVTKRKNYQTEDKKGLAWMTLEGLILHEAPFLTYPRTK